MKVETLKKGDQTGRNEEELNNAVRNITFGNNLSGEVLEDIVLPVGEEVEIPHNLKAVPKFRIVLRQRGELTIVDGEKAWTDKVIYLKAISSVGTGLFTKNIGFTNYIWISPSSPAGGLATTSNFTYGSIDNQGFINKNVLNDAISGGTGSSATQATISILLMRG